MAAPHVTGTVALVLAQHPDWTYSQIIQRILTTTTPLASLAGKTVTGGLINAAAAVSPPPVSPPTSGVLFRDDFAASTPGAAWRTSGGSWAWHDGVLSQSALQPGDPQKAMVADGAYPDDVEIAARVRVDSWSGGDRARAGVSLAQTENGLGYNLLFRDGGVQFLDDYVAWSPLFPFAWSVGTWYQFRLRSSGGVLYGKVWQDGAAEPSTWMFTQSGWGDRHGGAPGLNGGSGGATVSFDDVVVSRVDAQTTVSSTVMNPAVTAPPAVADVQSGSATNNAAAREAESGSRSGSRWWLRLPRAARHQYFRKDLRVNQGSGR